jgi:hypothetical protein
MPYEDAITGWVITPDDDGFHEASDHPWETETFWVSWNLPERKMGGWFYNQVLANQGDGGICNGGAHVWDDSAEATVYRGHVQGVPMPAERDLRDIALPNGNTVQTREPLMKYHVTRHDGDAFTADLIFEGIMEPNPHPAGVAPFWRGRHFDQAMHVTGTVTLHGERLEIDCLSVRDRSWSPRPPPGWQRERRPDEPPPSPRPPRPRFTLGYIFGTASPQDAFLTYTLAYEDKNIDEVTTGYLIRDGVWAHIVSGHRSCLVDPENEWISHIEFEGTDTLGRTIEAVGEQLSIDSSHGAGNGLYRWRWDGVEGYGENQGGVAPIHARTHG